MVKSSCTAVCLALFAVCAEGARKRRRTGSNSSMVDCYSPYDGQALLSLNECTSPAEVVSKLEKSKCTFVSEEQSILQLGCEGAEVVCSHGAVADLMEIANVVTKDAGAYWRGSSGTTVAFGGPSATSSDFYTNWRDLAAQSAQVESLVASSGGIATIETAGQTLEGRDIKLVRFRGAGYSSGGTRIFVTFNLHAREWITGMSGVHAVETLIEKVRQDPNYLAGTEVVLMPMANPDGFHYSTTTSRMHRKNMRSNGCSNRGIDLNRNFDGHWNQGGSSSDPCSDTYHGPSAGSEPETQVVQRVMREAPMTVYIDVHAYSQLIISSYGWTRAEHPRKVEYREVGGLIQSAIRSVGGNTWTEGATAQVLYQASGTTIDEADELGALGICFELRPGRWGGGGFAPPASDISIGVRECSAGLFAAYDYAMNPPAPPAPTPAPAPGSWVIEGSGCVMNGNCISSNNHPSNYGNSEVCSIKLGGSVDITVEAFNTESRYDYLTVGGSRYAGTSGPRSGSYSGTISWSTDSSVTKSGWKLCK